ncbi:aminopeptidase N [Brevibacterium sp. 50QC2O2]|uniref:aminopeptidase N n=1 Tax=Brevibacterium TaxID=1696 RepID=UPI00211CFE50|nr:MULTISPECIES: aminopeptidase N [unclassified Brevibacterium]MCQ9368927.1 aminopeptidase N [Brevibacterium sp. 91QC2O2]MCQ9385998.1 aminopeptidase N [Brevibacterium sp. 68QC2CO]MCQ9387711.1 aminopeptidase N [Brevibacterium sp. 50QC2O2]
MTTNLTRAEAQARAALLTVHTYTVELDLANIRDRSAMTFGSTTTVTFTARDAGTTFIDFIADSVERVRIGETELDPAEAFDGARIAFPVVPGGNTLIVEGRARYSRSGEGLHRFFDPADGLVYTYTQFEPTDARRVFANFDQPDLKATFDFRISAPDDLVALSNGTVVPASDAGAEAPAGDQSARIVRHVFATTKRQSSYITCVAVGDYAAAHDVYTHPATGQRIELGVFARASLADHMDAAEIFAITKSGLDFYHDFFDYPYPWGKYDQIFVPEYNLGAMENPGLVTFTDSYLYRDAVTRTQYESRANTILHEMTHMWFGDLVTMRWWDDLWLKESFADYMGGLALAEATEYTDGWVSFALRRKDWAYRQDQYPTTHPIVADIPDVEAAKLNFDGITYAKGAAVLKQLVAYVGRDAFRAGARAYFRAHEFSNTTLEDFLTALQAAAPQRDVRAWAAAWLQTTGMSEMSLDVRLASEVPASAGAGARLAGSARARGSATAPTIAQATVTQRNSDGTQVVRPHTLQLAGFNRSRRRLEAAGTWRLDMAGAQQSVPELAGIARPDLLLLNHGDDDFVKVRLDQQSTQTALAAVSGLADPLDRALIWSALSNATRDGLLPATDFLAAYAAGLGREHHAGIFAGLRTQALTAFDRWTPADAQSTALEDMLGSALDALRLSTQDSDTQLGLAELVLALVRRSVVTAEPGPAVAAGRAFASQLLSVPVGSRMGEATAGLRVDHHLRWTALIALVALGWADYDDIDAEEAGDRTGSGVLSGITARAARPLPIVKMRAFTQATSDPTLSNDELSALIRGFSVPAALPLTESFVEEYFTRLDTFWVGPERSIEIGKRLLLGLYPSWSSRPARVVELTTDWLADHPTAPAAQRRLVVELLDDMQRALSLSTQPAPGASRGRH